MRKYLSRLHIFAVLAMIVGSPLAAADGEDEDQAPGWYYLWAQCTQEPSTWDNPALCSMGVEGEWYQALAISSVFNHDGNDLKAHDVFEAEASRRFGFEVQATDVGPFANFAEAEQAIVEALRFSRMLQKGKLAVTAIALEPERLDDEPNDEERLGEPGPLPPVMESFRGGSANVWRDETAKACGLRLADGREIKPELVTDLWGEEGEGCPRELVAGSGIFRFDVPRNGMICGETGVCTELYDSAGHWIGVIEETPYPMILDDFFRDWGIIRSGQWNERIYSIPERRHLFNRWPGGASNEASRMIIHGGAIINDRLAIEVDLEYRTRKPEIGYFWLDTMTFELAREAGAGLNPVQKNAVEVANSVCLSADLADTATLEGPCTKALIMLDSAGLQDSLIAARVQMALGQLKAQRDARDAAIEHYQAVIAYEQFATAETGELPRILAGLEFGTPEYCSGSPALQLAISTAQLRQSWLALDAHAQQMIADFKPGDLAELNFAARRMMVLIGDLFPQFNRPMDVSLLANRLTTRSVPAFDKGNEEYKVALMEAFLSEDRENGAVAAKFVEALGMLEDATIAGDDVATTADLAEPMAQFKAAYEAFRPAIGKAVASDQLDRALMRRLPDVCVANADLGQAP